MVPAFSQLSGFDCGIVNTIPTAECEALVALYNNTNGDNWIDNTEWLQSADPCSLCTFRSMGFVSVVIVSALFALTSPLVLL